MLFQNSSIGATDALPPAEANLIGLEAKPGSGKIATADPFNSKERPRAPFPKQILVIDDDEVVRELVARTVTQAGFQADTAGDGEEGWTALCTTTYDLVITDHSMPKLTGLKLIERMRAVSIEPPCILITASLPLPEPILRQIVHRGTVLEKPFLPSDLIERVYGLLLLGDLQG